MRCVNNAGVPQSILATDKPIKRGTNVRELSANGEDKDAIRAWYKHGVPVERIAAAAGMTCRQVRRLCKAKRELPWRA